jgi:hypothetical protein
MAARFIGGDAGAFVRRDVGLLRGFEVGMGGSSALPERGVGVVGVAGILSLYALNVNGDPRGVPDAASAPGARP